MGWERRESCDRPAVGEETAGLTISKKRVNFPRGQGGGGTFDSNTANPEFEGISMDFMRHSVPSSKTAGRCGYVLAELIERYPDPIRLHQDGADFVPRHIARREKRVSAGCGIEVAKCADTSHSFAF